MVMRVVKLLLLLLMFLECFDQFCSVNGGETIRRQSFYEAVFNVMSFGAIADGFTDDSQAFSEAWKAMCASAGDVKLVIPKKTFLVGPLKFNGPCTNTTSITFQLKGYLKASTDLSEYVEGDDWVEFGWIDNLALVGGGTFDGQGSSSWPSNNCPTDKDCKVLPTSLKFVHSTNTEVRRIDLVNSKFFHMATVGCTNFIGSNIRITAPQDSPNTDGIHIDRSSNVILNHLVIKTGDDCISVGQGNSNVTISNIICGPGHGISVGSLGRYENEEDVKGLTVKDCILKGTDNGLRIKTWQNSPGKSTATNITFENITMHGVANPIIIDQKYCPYEYCNTQLPSLVEIRDIVFKDITGTSTTPVAVTLDCSRGYPCQNIKLQNVYLQYIGEGKSTALCSNVQASYRGTQVPPPCH